MASDAKDHPSQVDAWLTTATHELGPECLLELFEQTVQELWDCAHGTLSEITLRAIFDRVLHNAAERYPAMSSIQVDDSGVVFSDFKPELQKGKEQELKEAFRFMIVEFLAIAGSLTDQVITPALHARLSKVTFTKRATK